MATIGFSMLLTFLLITNITHKMTIALLIGAIVTFCLFIILKRLRKHLNIILALIGVISFTISFIGAEKYYFNERKIMESEQLISGVVCEIPDDSDYAFSYIIKPENKRYKLRFVSSNDEFLKEGDRVKLVGVYNNENLDSDMFLYSLSSRVYFTYFESDSCTVEKTGEVSYYYKNIGAVKRAFSEIVTQYLPGANGAVARAITIGDKSELDDKITDYFNYCGTSHLLVISGLHLTLWSTYIVSFLNKFSKMRKYSSYIGIACLLLYSAVTGFTVSVLRAGAMVGAVLVARFFDRDADSINSIGLAIVCILLFNPFAPYSAALWLSVLSTLGILAYSGKITQWISEKIRNTRVFNSSLYHLVVTSFSISLSTAVLTLPVFIFKLKMVSVVTVFTNFIMVDLSLVMMVSTVLGVISNMIFLRPFAKLFFFISGVLGEVINTVAEKVGMAEWSTISLDHKYYEYFFVFAIICLVIGLLVSKKKIQLTKYMTACLFVIFVVITIYCVSCNYNTPVAEIVGTDKNPVITVNYKNETVLVGTQKKKYIDDIKSLMSKYNKKKLDMLVVTEMGSKIVQEIINIYDNFGKTKTGFTDSAPGIFEDVAQSNITGFSIDRTVNVYLYDKDYTVIEMNGKRLFIISSEKAENVFEKAKECDIIIKYGENDPEDNTIMQCDAKIVELYEGKRVTVAF